LEQEAGAKRGIQECEPRLGAKMVAKIGRQDWEASWEPGLGAELGAPSGASIGSKNKEPGMRVKNGCQESEAGVVARSGSQEGEPIRSKKQEW